MNQFSLRQSPGGSTAFSRHCSSRCVLVKVPSFSACPAAGNRNTSVGISSVLSSPRCHFGRFVPERGGFGFHHVADDEPFQFAERAALHSGIRPGDGGILAHDKQAVHLSVQHVEPIAVVRVVAGNARQPIETKIVFRLWLHLRNRPSAG